MVTRLMCWMFVLAVILAGTASADLVGHWRYNEGTGAVTSDASGNGNNGTFTGSPRWVPGQLGGALAFDGDDWVDYGDIMDISAELSIACWVNPSGLELDKGWVARWDNYAFKSNGSSLRFTTPGVLDYTADNTTLVIGEWQHVAITFVPNQTEGAIFYLQGVEAQRINSTGYGSGGGPFGIGNNRWDQFYEGMIDDVRVYDHILTPEEITNAMLGGGPELAGDPIPRSEAVDVSRDVVMGWSPGDFAVTHDVYLGTTFADVNDATAGNPLGVLASQGQGATTFDPGRLEFGQSYFWRVDEVNGAPSFSVFGGNVWSFTVEPLSRPISNITATASSSSGPSGPEKTIDGSGLADDLHGISAKDMWVSAGVPASIEYAFDRAYKLHELWVWNSNQTIEAFIGFGAKDVVIEHSLDGENWTLLDGVGPLAQAPGTEGYAHNTTIDFGGVIAQHVRVTVNTVQGIAPQASLSEVRFFFIPTLATGPSPVSGAADVSPDVPLAWGSDGREAGSHEVYVGTDASTLSLAGSVSESSIDTSAVDLQLSQTYYWRVDEVNDAMDPSVWTGDVWSFTTADTIPIDDMEAYADEEFLEIWATWVDGFDDPANNGALVGNGVSGSPETGIVHAGSQSLPLHFDNTGAALSETTRTFESAMDWTKHGVQSLVLYLNRGVDNTGGGQVYLKINDTKVVFEGGTDLPPAWDAWSLWTIDLSTVADAASVRSLTIGVEGAGAMGVLYVDSIQLVENAPAVSAPPSWFEAEAADILGASWKVVADPTASGGSRIGSEAGDGDDNNTAPGAEWVAAYTFTVPADGEYGLSLRAQEAGFDSFWVRIVGATSQSHEDPDQPGTGWVRFNEIDAPNGWAWDQVHSNDHGNAIVSWTLPAGPVTLEIAKREAGVYLDAIAVTD